MNVRLRTPVRLLILLIAVIALIGLPRATSAASLVLLSGYPALRQQHSLTCESAAGSMATRGVISEDQLMSAMPRSPNPNIGFRGNPDGLQGTKLVDYGVYAGPLHNALLQYGFDSTVLNYATDRDLRTFIRAGWPVVVWITYGLQPARPRLAAWQDELFVLVPHEHAVTAVGFDPGHIIANDPWTGTVVRYPWRAFNRSWGLFSNMGLAVQPCALPQPVPYLHLSTVSTAGLTWTWGKAPNASAYVVTVVHSKHDKVIYTGTQTARSYTVASPLPGTQYGITVVPVSSCGGQAQPQRMQALLPAILPTPAITPTPESTVVLTPSGTPSIVPTGTITPTATVTATP